MCLTSPGQLKRCKSPFLPICHCQAGGAGAESQGKPDPVQWDKAPEQCHQAIIWVQRLVSSHPFVLAVP